MTYKPTEWKNTVYDDEENELQKGTPYSAENMNKIEAELVDLSAESHTHENKAVLDTVTQEVVDKTHGHVNKAILDSIGTDNVHKHPNKAVIDQLNQSHIDDKHTHGNKALLDDIKPTNVHEHMNKVVLDNVTQAHLDVTHTHANKAILDAVVAENVHGHSNKPVIDALTQQHLTDSHKHENRAVLDKVTQLHLDNIVTHGVTLSNHEQRLVDLVETITSLKIKVVQTIAERDALVNKDAIIIHVVDATADSTVDSGWAQYIYQSNIWVKIAENESIDVVLAWANIVGKPSTYPPSSHGHNIMEISGLQVALNDKETLAGTIAKVNAHANLNTNPHDVTKAQVGLGNVDNVKQAPKTEFDTHSTDSTRHITAAERTAWNQKAGGAHTHGWGEVTGKPATFAPSTHTHTEADIIGLDKYTKAEVDTKLSGKAAATHSHTISQVTGLQAELNAKETPAGVQQKVTTHAEDSLLHVTFAKQLAWDAKETPSGAQAKVNTHSNDAVKHVTAVERNAWNGAVTTVQAHATQLGELATHTHDYSALTNKPSIPSKTSDITNDSNFITSNAARITVSPTAPSNPLPNDIWIVI